MAVTPNEGEHTADYERCDVYYGTGGSWPNGGAVCGRPKGHPSVADDGIGHSPCPTRQDWRAQNDCSGADE